MIEAMSRKTAELFVKNGLVAEEEKNVYEYGMEFLISTLFSTLMVLMIGLAAGLFTETLFLLVPFYCIRVYAGGYHAENYRNCFLSFCWGFIVVLLAAEKVVACHAEAEIMMFELLAVLLIWKLAPVEDHSRPLDLEEWRTYQRKARMMTLICGVVSELMYFLWGIEYAVYVSAAVTAIGLVLIVGIIKNRIIGFTGTVRYDKDSNM